MIQVKDVRKVYSGKAGACCCGCSGKYWYAPGEPHEEWQGKESLQQVKRIVAIVNANVPIQEVDDNLVCVTIQTGQHTSRWYIVHLKDLKDRCVTQQEVDEAVKAILG